MGADTMFEIADVGQGGRDRPRSASTGDKVRNIFFPERFLALGARLQDSVSNPFGGPIPTGALSRSAVARSQLLMAYPHFRAVNIQRPSRTASSYHSLQVSANQRMSHGLQLQAAYTWSKLLEKLRFINPSDPEPSKMIGEFDNLHRVSLGFIYEMPFGKRFSTANPVIGRMAGGWQVSGIYIYQTRAAVWLRAIVHTGISPKIDNPSIDGWFNRDSMTILPAFTARWNPWMWDDLRAADFHSPDVAVLKYTALGPERTDLRFRAEFINVFNWIWFGTTDVNPSSAN